uniref:Uncharacterized protein n=1 Tax=Acrobeloides nanus TaxID=290746 RepID=A0A914CBV3_9BILA
MIKTNRKGFPYRKPLYTNMPMILTITILTLVSSWVTIYPQQFVISFLSYDPIPYFVDRLFYAMLGVLSGIVSYMMEHFIVDELLLGVIEKRNRQNFKNNVNNSKYEKIIYSIAESLSWLSSDSIDLRNKVNFKNQEDIVARF